MEELPNDSPDDVVAAAIGVCRDAKLSKNITTVAEYSAFRNWAIDVTGNNLQMVKDSPNAWISYALDTAGLITDEPKEGDLMIDGFSNGAADGKFELVASVDGISVGNGATDANLRKVFEIEGTSAIMCSNGTDDGFSADNVKISVAEPSGGKVKFTVTPKVAGGKIPDSFFFKVKMK